MSYWDILLKEIQEKKRTKPYKKLGSLLDEPKSQETVHRSEITAHSTFSQHKFYLHTTYHTIHLTAREAQCVYCLMHDLTMKKIGRLLNLSHRTIEFYINNIKDKIGIRRKQALRQFIEKTDFMAQFKASSLYASISDLNQQQ